MQVKAICAITSKGPDTLTGLVARIYGQTTVPADWTVRLSPTGAPLPGNFALVPIGSLAPGQTKTVTTYITPNSPGNQLNAGCNVQGPSNENIIEPPFDRAGDFGAAINLHSVSSLPPSSTASTSPPATTSAALANTGSPSRHLVEVALLALLIGAGLQAGSRTATRQAKHRRY
ncbi:MAG: hypothetical protein J0H43_08420 [Actinobacteria bacterium]|nr:hypothetical protein [Actinomycetota bacterium]